MDCRGYSKRVVDANSKSTSDSLGIRLGRHCIKNDIAVSYIAAKIGVSRMTIYNWFVGKSEPRDRYRLPIERLLKQHVEENKKKQL